MTFAIAIISVSIVTGASSNAWVAVFPVLLVIVAAVTIGVILLFCLRRHRYNKGTYDVHVRFSTELEAGVDTNKGKVSPEEREKEDTTAEKSPSNGDGSESEEEETVKNNVISTDVSTPLFLPTRKRLTTI